MLLLVLYSTLVVAAAAHHAKLACRRQGDVYWRPCIKYSYAINVAHSTTGIAGVHAANVGQ